MCFKKTSTNYQFVNELKDGTIVEISGREALKIFAKDMFFYFLVPMLFIMPFLLFVVRPTYIQSGSMEPTLMTGKIYTTNSITLFGENKGVEHGDVVIFYYPENRVYGDDFTVKRAIALPGDTIEIVQGIVYLNGEELDEPYAVPDDRYNVEELIIPEGEMFVMGDNRQDSFDSRAFGTFPLDSVKYKVNFK